eukprot:CAMPEP_0183399800 /NCGR_PEP_ID=MMETSP0370-20130417/12179_1 /TAXON_ID=268820 /ORGANISM="Peridinium aciculiferum, Strain PAER-2" /LENGTH=138 /DNA_ID=CAMNT_0025581011 /DNA_START=165 /DNA_END=581 /DNA_ORIENTATION=+
MGLRAQGPVPKHRGWALRYAGLCGAKQRPRRRLCRCALGAAAQRLTALRSGSETPWTGAPIRRLVWRQAAAPAPFLPLRARRRSSTPDGAQVGACRTRSAEFRHGASCTRSSPAQQCVPREIGLLLHLGTTLDEKFGF